MALITRVTRLFRADMHAVLDHIEEPDALLKQAIREMEDDIYQDERKLKETILEQKQLTSRQDGLTKSLEQTEDELDICFFSKKDDLARALIKRKLETKRFVQFLDQKMQNLIESLTELETCLKENRSRLDSMKQKAELFADDNRVSASEFMTSPDLSVRDEDVEVAFLREQQNRRSS